MKSYRFLHFCQFFLIKKKHCKNRYFSTFFEAINYKKNGNYYRVQVGSYYLVQVGCVLKNANLDQIITSKFFLRAIFPKNAETTTCFIFFAIGVLEKTNLDQIITSKTPKLGPDNNSTAYIYICLSYIYTM